MDKILMSIGALLAALAVGMGAFGAHGLKAHLSDEMMAVYKTAVDYHMYHALGTLLIGILIKQYPSSLLMAWSGGLMVTGILLFSGSLYLLCVTDMRWLGIVTPFGGLALIMAWFILLAGLWRDV
ncbi:MAG: DUF423 domain-containing protein [Pseudomonadota bacterium]